MYFFMYEYMYLCVAVYGRVSICSLSMYVGYIFAQVYVCNHLSVHLCMYSGIQAISVCACACTQFMYKYTICICRHECTQVHLHAYLQAFIVSAGISILCMRLYACPYTHQHVQAYVHEMCVSMYTLDCAWNTYAVLTVKLRDIFLIE